MTQFIRSLAAGVILTAFAAGAGARAEQATPTTLPTARLPGLTTVAPVDVPDFKPVRPFAGMTPVFDNAWTWNEAYPGTVATTCEGGFRYDAQPNVAGRQEESAWVGGYGGPQEDVDTERLRAFARGIQTPVLILDIEHWEIDVRAAPNYVVEGNIRKFRRIVSIIRQERPDLLVGLYGFMPTRDYWTPNHFATGQTAWEKYKRGETLTPRDLYDLNFVSSVDSTTGQYVWDDKAPANVEMKAWRAANDRMNYGYDIEGKADAKMGLIQVVDAVFPSVYLFYDHTKETGSEASDLAADTAYLRGMVREAKRYGKPVYPFLMPAVNSAPTEDGTALPVSEARWHNALRVLKDEGADGVYLWGMNRKSPVQQKMYDQAIEIFGAYQRQTQGR